MPWYVTELEYLGIWAVGMRVVRCVCTRVCVLMGGGVDDCRKWEWVGVEVKCCRSLKGGS